MGRWKPDARGRLARAAFELYAEQGYERTKGAEIAARAGMHERSFFRLFGDRREVPFHGMTDAAAELATTIRAAAPKLSAMELVLPAVEAQCRRIQESQQHAVARDRLISSSAELRERDLAKHAELVAAMVDALLERGVRRTTAALAAESCVLGLRVAIKAWVRDPDVMSLVQAYRGTMAELSGLLSPVGDTCVPEHDDDS